MSVCVLNLVSSLDSLELSLIDFRHLIDALVLYVTASLVHLGMTTVHYLITVILRTLFVCFRIT